MTDRQYYRCMICGAVVPKTERTAHLLNWLIPKHAEWFVGAHGKVWRGTDGQIYYTERIYNDGDQSVWKSKLIQRGRPHVTRGSTVSEYFNLIPPSELWAVAP